ncbi:MAG: hypothetical protein ACKOCN_04825 [Planctomycetaceae bacterium]
MKRDDPFERLVGAVLGFVLVVGGPFIFGLALLAALNFIGDLIFPESWKTAPVRSRAQQARDSEDAYWEMIRESNTPRFER